MRRTRIGASIMSDEEEADPLFRAIGEFRRELMQWIDQQVECLQGQQDVLEAVARAESPPLPSPRAEASQAAPTGDARTRLDTLARQLSDRLRGGEVARPVTAASRPNGAEAGPGPAR